MLAPMTSLEFGVTILPDPPCSRFVELVQAAEAAGYDWAYTYDSHILWQDGSAFLAVAAAQTERIGLGFCVTNPGTREPTVTASFHATLNTMAPGRVAVQIGRGDSARRTIGLEPVKVREFEAATELIRELANGRTAEWNGKQITLEWAKDLPEIPVWVAGYGPRALGVAGRQGNGVVIQLADADIIDWIMGQARAAAEEAGRDPDLLEPIVCAPAVISDDIAAARDASRWFPAMVSNHVVDLLKRYDQSQLPASLTGYPRAARVLRLLGAQPNGCQARRVRRRRDLRPLLHPRHGRGSHREAPRPPGARRQAVQHVSDDGRPGRAFPALRRAPSSPSSRTRPWRSTVSRSGRSPICARWPS